ncbi:hypothetical protein ABH931_004020 [Streptacidiphilus sp. MAP12-33]|uniref:serine/threonine-protein kinase n=1 Tax=Streptacidiphilus sp. MAP12-33 TaxID=3156266 RepID=UPI00351781A5
MSDGERVVAGRYRLVAQLGRGGMGTVWRAEDLLLGRQVAVKEVHPRGGGDDAEQRERTLREAQVVARISHPSVVGVHDVVEQGGRPWIVMELVDGASLATRIATEGPLPADETARMGLAVLDALCTAHALGVLHRDVKPANVLWERDKDRWVLTDFGIARVDGEATLTEAGAFLGSPEFTAPERLHGDDAGPAADLWSLGALLVAALDGRSLFHRTAITAVLHAVAFGPITLPDRAQPLAPVIGSLLHRDPRARPQAAVVRAQLEQFLRDGAVDAPPGAPDATLRGAPGASGMRSAYGGQVAPAGPAHQADHDAQAGRAGQEALTGGTGSAVQAGFAAEAVQAGFDAQAGRVGQEALTGGTGSAGQAGRGAWARDAAPVPQAGHVRHAGHAPQAGRTGQAGEATGAAQMGPASPAPQAGRTGQGSARRSGRRWWRSVGAGAVVVAAAVGGSFAVDVWSGAPTPSARSGGASASASASPASVTVVPAGFARYRDSHGFSVVVPAGWDRQVDTGDGTRVYYVSPGQGTTPEALFKIGIRVQPGVAATPLTAQVCPSPTGYAAFRATPPRVTTLSGHRAASCSFTWSGTPGGPPRVSDLLLWTDAGATYTLWASGPTGDRARVQQLLATAAGGFTPAPR